MNRALVLGGSGLVGSAVINEMNKYSHFEVYSTYFENPILLDRDRNFKFDIENIDNLNAILNDIKPNIVVSSLRGDFNKQLIVHEKISQYLKTTGGSLYFFSTTNVFDNDYSRPHYEEDLPNAQSEYGQYKLECERKILDILSDNACILRIPQVWGKNSPRMKELQNSLSNNKNIVLYPKLFFNINTDVMIARKLCYIINNDLKGIFHLVSEDEVNYKDFYYELITRLGFNNATIEDDFEAEGHFTLLSKRNNNFPKQLRFTYKSVIDYLTL